MGKTVITYGTFDMFHVGHLNLLRRLAEMGDRLVVAVSTDEFNEQKGKKVLIPYEQRAAIVQAIEYVDLVIPEQSWEQKQTDIVEHDVSIFAIGKDWEGQFDFLKPTCDVVYLARTQDVSTTELKRTLSEVTDLSSDEFTRIFSALEILRHDLQ